MKLILSLFILVSMNVFTVQAKSAPKKAAEAYNPFPPIKKGTDVEISYYDANSDTYWVTIKKETAIGPNIVTPEVLYKATRMSRSLEEFKKMKNDNVGEEFVLQDDLYTMSDEDVEKRQEQLQTSK